ncbi:MAG: HAD-IA family hydrolase [Planctomycetes bacterium]|nr:HAD-IA family hydrolase [Planctomycetota bacterium]
MTSVHETSQPDKPYKMILWDFDGTLADSLSSGLTIYNQIADRYRLNRITEPARLREMSSREVMKHLKIPFWKLPWVIRDFIAKQRESIEAIKLFPEIESVLQILANTDLTLGILSSNSEESIRICLNANGVEQHFDFVVGHVRLFGKQTALKRTITEKGLSAAEVLYVGDEIRDVDAARKANVDIASVAWGWHSAGTLNKQEPTYLVTTPWQLCEIPRIRCLDSVFQIKPTVSDLS